MTTPPIHMPVISGLVLRLSRCSCSVASLPHNAFGIREEFVNLADAKLTVVRGDKTQRLRTGMFAVYSHNQIASIVPDKPKVGFVHLGNGMKDDQQRFLALLGKLPARLIAEQVAWVLNCQPHDVPVLVASRLLKPLGNPAPNGIKFFATSDVIELSNDRAWLAKMTNTVTQHWQKKNARQKDSPLPLAA